MSFREKSAWACLATTLIVFVPYFVNVFQLFGRGELTGVAVLGEFLAALTLEVVLQVVVHIVFAIFSKQENKDERDLAIESKSVRNAYYVLAAFCMSLIFCVIALAPIATVLPSAQWLGPVFLSQMFLLCFVLAEAIKYLTQVVSYRRGS